MIKNADINSKQNDRFYVYIHVKQTNGEVFYVGKGCGRRAWSRSGRNRKWKSIEDKHGFFALIIKENLSEHDAYAEEAQLIDYFGIENLATFVAGGGGTSGYRHTDETKASMSLSRTGIPMSDRAKLAMSESIRSSPRLIAMRRSQFNGDRNPAKKDVNRRASSERMKKENPMKTLEVRESVRLKMVGRKLSEEHKLKLSLVRMGKPTGPRSQEGRANIAAAQEKRKQPVETDCGLRFPGMVDASRATGVRQGSISNNCVGRTKSAGGYKWRFAANDNVDQGPEEIRNELG